MLSVCLIFFKQGRKVLSSFTRLKTSSNFINPSEIYHLVVTPYFKSFCSMHFFLSCSPSYTLRTQEGVPLHWTNKSRTIIFKNFFLIPKFLVTNESFYCVYVFLHVVMGFQDEFYFFILLNLSINVSKLVNFYFFFTYIVYTP